MKNKRTKKDYDQLYRSPKHLFPPTASSAGVDTILFPNGQNEIWFKDEYGRHFTVVASSGPAGFSVTVKAGFNASATLLGAKYPGYECFDEDDVKEVTLCQYNQDEASQAFKAWYLADASNKETRKELRQRYEALIKRDSEPKPDGDNKKPIILIERDCMRCEETFTDDGDNEFCPKCLQNMNRIDI
jgi:hypothetical protein